MFDPDRTTLGVDVSGTPNTIREVAGNPAFAFIRARHREVVLQDADALRGFIRELVSNLPERRHLVGKADTLAYANARLAVSDEEWQAAVGAEGATSWLKKLRKK